MKDKHIVELKIFHANTLNRYKEDMNNLIFDKTTELTLYVNGRTIDIHEFYIELLDDGCIKIDCCFYNDGLFDFYKNKNKIHKMEEKGFFVNYNNVTELLPYIRMYKNYKIKSVSGGSKCDESWTYILKPCWF